jgi:hypothetical protein
LRDSSWLVPVPKNWTTLVLLSCIM